MRLDKFVSVAGALSRREAGDAIRGGRVALDGLVIRDPKVQVAQDAVVTLDDQPIVFREFIYIMLNKPEGYVSSTDDPGAPTVLDLLPPEHKTRGLFPCGRLDRYTTGLIILTNDGVTAHRLLAPKNHVEKTYSFTCRDPLEHTDTLEAGVRIAGGYVTKPCVIEATGTRTGLITLREGKYHQIKQMFESVGNKITALSRVEFAGIPLDPALEPGSWRELTADEVVRFLSGGSGAG